MVSGLGMFLSFISLPLAFASSQGPQSSSEPTDSPFALSSVLSMSSRLGEQRGDRCCHTGCCLNGGVCFPSSDFCQCPKQFYGYRCEKRRMRVCGSVKHLQWARLGCNLCRCFDSRLLCMSHIYSGCDGKPPKEDIDINAYKDDISIFPMNEAPSSATDNDYSSNIDRDMKENNSSDDTNSSKGKTPSKTISSGNTYTDFNYYNYSDNEDEENDNISSKSDPSSKIRTLTFGGYYWTFLMCLVSCLINWTLDVNIGAYFIS